MSPVLFALLLALPAIGEPPLLLPPPPPIPPGPVIFEIGPDLMQNGKELHGSKFGSIARLQKALSQALKDCAQEITDQKAKAQQGGSMLFGPSPAPAAPTITEVTADGILGPKTLNAVAQLLLCPIARRIAPWSPLRKGQLSSELWDIVPMAGPKPDVFERALTLELALDGGETDYDRATWEYGPPVPPAVLAWGPFGATIGGGEVQNILQRLDPLLPVVRRLMEKLDGADVKQQGAFNTLHAVYRSSKQRARWREDFATLGHIDAVRAQYDELSRKRLAEPLGDLYCLYHEEGVPVSEVDFAFFLDLAIHLQITPQRIASATASLGPDAKKSTPATRRQAVAEAMIADLPCAERADQRKRSVAFYDEPDLRQHFSADESLALTAAVWSVRPADCGLDERPFPQSFPQPCPRPASYAPEPAATPGAAP